MNNALQVAIEEYKVLHAQVLERIRRQQHIISTGSILGAAILTFFATSFFSKADPLINYQLISYLLLILTVPFYVLTRAYAYDDYMIGVTVGILHKRLRPNICRLADDDTLLLNERFFVLERKRKKIINWFPYHLILLIFPCLLLSNYIAIILLSLYTPTNHHIVLQFLLLCFNIILIIGVIILSVMGEKNILKAGQPNNNQKNPKKK